MGPGNNSTSLHAELSFWIIQLIIRGHPCKTVAESPLFINQQE